MNDTIRFEKHVQRAAFHNPMKGGRLDTQEIEIRRDPLTGHQSVFNPGLEEKAPIFFKPTDRALIEKIAGESEPGCFLCEDRWREMTPTYPEEVVPGGRIEVGRAVLFPNLFPVAQVHAVVRVGERHHLPLGDFEAAVVLEAFRASLQFIKAVVRADGTVRHMTVNGNFLGPAGASIVHPHFQILGGDLPFTSLEQLLAGSGDYYAEHSSCYWTDLVEAEEAAGNRYIGRTGPVSWIASFSPRGTNEVLGIFTSKRDFLELDDEDLGGLAQGFSKVLAGYDSLGASTFNFTIYSGPLGDRDESFRCVLRILSRQNVYENYRTDDYFLQKLLQNELILLPPEALASTMRDAFSFSSS